MSKIGGYGGVLSWMLTLGEYAMTENNTSENAKSIIEIDGVGPQTESVMRENGYESLEDLRGVTVADMKEVAPNFRTAITIYGAVQDEFE